MIGLLRPEHEPERTEEERPAFDPAR